jgi:UDP-N-acetylmuramoyl-tripeptide--D-alanyl-D-alanine ligase
MLIRNLLYILQQDNYELKPFLAFCYTHKHWWRFEQRSKLTWTAKTKLLYATSWLLILLLGLGIYKFASPWLLPILLVSLPLIISLGLILISPVDRFFKLRLIAKAKNILRTRGQHLTVIGITGSYGKTSARELLSTILARKFRVFTSPDNINTDLGLAQLILSKQDQLSSSEIFVVEMGAFRRGEIKTICDMVEPDYSILTGINESHLEKFGSLENIIKAKFELAESTKLTSALNSANQSVKDNYQRFAINKPLLTDPADAKNLVFLPDYQGFEFTYRDTLFRTSLLAAHNIELILPCLLIAQELGMDLAACAEALKAVKAVPHRLELIRNTAANLYIIDDSYNGNVHGFKSGLEVLSRAPGRKLVLTPGLVELGDQAEKIHTQIGEWYAGLPVDLVLLVANKCTNFIVNGLKKHNFTDYKIYPNTQAAHSDLGNILKSGDTIIFQNDWPDNYF